MNFREYLNSSDLGRHYLNEGVIEVKQISNYIKLANELKSSYDDIQSIAKKYGSLKNFRNDFSDLLGEFADNLTDLQKDAISVRPKNKEELGKLIWHYMNVLGPNCDLNFIDVSNITDMSKLFYKSHFNGDISKWDVSNVENMDSMFMNSYFNSDISKWDVSNVENMDYMFANSKFNQDISKWDVSNVENMNKIFAKCPIKDEYKPHFR